MISEPLLYKLNKIEKVYNKSTVKQTVGWGILSSNVPESWITSEGEGCKVMVLDSGKPNHPDLKQQQKDIISTERIIIHKKDKKINLDRNFVPQETIRDLNGHHTHCAGIICAANNSFGMVGVAPKAELISVKILNKQGFGTIKALNSALRYAIKIKPDVISLSIGFTKPDKELHSIIKKLYKLNIPIVCAAGNGGKKQGVVWPAKYPETIAVGAFNKNGSIANFSAQGPSVDFAAPGASIMSTWLENKYAELSGTSMACPFIAGAICLLKSKSKKLKEKGVDDSLETVAQIKQALVDSSNDKGIIGKDDQWGFGVIDFEKLLD